MSKKNDRNKKPLTGLDRICGVQTMALSAEFLALQNTMFIEGRQLDLTNKFLHSKDNTKILNLFKMPMVYNSN